MDGGRQYAVEGEVLDCWMEGVVEGVGRTQAKPYLGFDTSSPNLFHIISILYFLNYYYSIL